jgi:hypothetical protein
MLAGLLRRWYRHTTHAMRLVLLFGAVAGPPLVTYPLTAAAADDAARALIMTDFAPAMLRQPEAVRETLEVARNEIDAIRLEPDESRDGAAHVGDRAVRTRSDAREPLRPERSGVSVR